MKIGCIHNTKAKIYIHVIINWRSNHFDTWHRFALVDFSFTSRSKFLSFPSSVFTGLSRNYWRRIDGYLIIMMIQKEMSGFLDSITAPFSVISFHFIPKPRRVLSLQKLCFWNIKSKTTFFLDYSSFLSLHRRLLGYLFPSSRCSAVVVLCGWTGTAARKRIRKSIFPRFNIIDVVSFFHSSYSLNSFGRFLCT